MPCSPSFVINSVKDLFVMISISFLSVKDQLLTVMIFSIYALYTKVTELFSGIAINTEHVI